MESENHAPYEGNVDSIGLYFKKMGDMPVLTKEQEQKYGKDIYDFRHAVYTLCTAKQEVLSRLGNGSATKELTGIIAVQKVKNVLKGLIKSLRSAKKPETIAGICEKLYLRIGVVEEIANGFYNHVRAVGLNGRQNYEMLKEERKAIKNAYKAYAEARDMLVKHNLRLVINIAKRYRNRGLPFSDLIGEGNVGLLKAATDFDYRKGWKFCTYTGEYIEHAIERALADKSRTIRLPVNKLEKINRINKARRELEAKLGREVSLQELSVKTKITVPKLKEYTAVPYEFSMQEPVGEDGDCLEDFIRDGKIDCNGHDDMIRKNKLAALVQSLPEKERTVITLLFDYKQNCSRTLEETGSIINRSRERVRQLKDEALAKLRLHKEELK